MTTSLIEIVESLIYCHINNITPIGKQISIVISTYSIPESSMSIFKKLVFNKIFFPRTKNILRYYDCSYRLLKYFQQKAICY